MSSQLDHRVRELAQSKPRLRSDLRFVLQEFQGEPCYLLEDPLKRRFFRVGMREYAFLQRLDGSRPLGKIVAQMAAASREEAFTEPEATSVVRWLADCDLLVTEDPAHAERLFLELHLESQPSRLLQKASALLFLKVPLGNPNRLLGALLPWLRWTLGWPFFFVWLPVILWGALTIAENWTRFMSTSQNVVSGRDVLGATLVWVVLKALHELWHGLMCKRHGLNVPEAGVMLLLLFTPLAYVDASSSLRLRDKWQRMSISVAGLYIELFCAAILAAIWSHSEPGWISNATHHGIILASVVTVLFNINPLMRFDGYYLLSDWLEIPNLFAKGQAACSFLFRRYLLGSPGAENPLAPSERFALIATYGVAALFWRVTVFFGLVLAAAALLKGAGLLVAVPVAIAACWNGIRRFFFLLHETARVENRTLAQVCWRPLLLLLGLLALLFGAQVRDSVRAPAVVELDQKAVLRTECPGFVRRVLVQAGQVVQSGDLLVEMENPAESATLAQLRFELERSQLHRRIYLLEESLGAAQAEAENATALSTRIAEMERYLATLTVKAPMAGIVDGRHLMDLPGSYLRVGEEIVTISEPGSMKLTVAVPQEDVELFRENLGQMADVRFVADASVTSAPLARIEAGATRDIPHFALAALSGGPLTVEARSDKRHAELTGNAAPAGNWQLSQPHFRATVPLSPGESATVHEGNLAWVKVSSGQRHSLAQLAERWMIRLFGRKLEALRAAAS